MSYISGHTQKIIIDFKCKMQKPTNYLYSNRPEATLIKNGVEMKTLVSLSSMMVANCEMKLA